MVSDDGLSIAAMHRICKKAGAERVSESAAREMAEVLEGLGLQIGREALDYTMHAGRETVKGRDARIAAEKILKQS